MILRGNLTKMRAEYNHPIDYYLKISDREVYINELIGKKISFEFNGQINCIHCAKLTKTSFSQGFCYNCMQTAPEADESIMRPELSMAQFGIAKDLKWAKEHDLIDHFVYLSVTSGLKVGVTRYHQVPTRWIDQGAVRAIKLAQTPNRHIAGIIECSLKKYVTDKTSWQAMLKGEYDASIDLVFEKNKLAQKLHPEFQKYLVYDNDILEINYPGDIVFDKVNSVGFDKMNKIEGDLVKIKGQYLIFQNEMVLNIRKHSGYYVTFKINE